MRRRKETLTTKSFSLLVPCHYYINSSRLLPKEILKEPSELLTSKAKPPFLEPRIKFAVGQSWGLGVGEVGEDGGVVGGGGVVVSCGNLGEGAVTVPFFLLRFP